MKDINSVTLSGRLTRDAEIFQTKTGKVMLKFSIANNRGKKKMGEQWVDQEPNFFNFIMFGTIAEKLAQYMTKGKQIVVTGELQQNRWTDQLGVKKNNIGIIAKDVLLVGDKKNQGYQTVTKQEYIAPIQKQEYQAPIQKTQYNAPVQVPQQIKNDIPFDDEIPF